MPNATVVKQTIGIDISANRLQTRVGFLHADGQRTYPAEAEFANTSEGLRKVYQWAIDQTSASIPLWFIMEATGVYYEQLAYFLHEQTDTVCVLVPHRAAHYAKSRPLKSKTDKIDARMLACYGLERQPRRWQPASRRLREIKLLLRERDQLKDQRTRLKCRLHAHQNRWQPPAGSIRRLEDQLEKIAEHIQEITCQISQLWTRREELSEPIKRISSVDGLSQQTVLQVVAETHGFALITNRRQLASYSGLDVVLDQSGNRQGTTKISKQGNTHIRRALYMPALSAIQHNDALCAFYQRLVQRHPDRKKMAVVAVMRKLLLLIYSLWKSGQEYDPKFHYREITQTD